MTGAAFEMSLGYEIYTMRTDDFREATQAMVQKRKGKFEKLFLEGRPPVNVGLTSGGDFLGADAQVEQLAHRIGLQVDAHAQRLELGHGFVDDAGHAHLVQGEGQGHAADAAAGDQHRCGGVVVVRIHGRRFSVRAPPPSDAGSPPARGPPSPSACRCRPPPE